MKLAIIVLLCVCYEYIQEVQLTKNDEGFFHTAIFDIMKANLKDDCSVIMIADDNPGNVHLLLRTSDTCVFFLIITDSYSFFGDFNTINLENHLLKGQNKVLIATRLSDITMNSLSQSLWTYEMLTVAILCFKSSMKRGVIFYYNPFVEDMGDTWKPHFQKIGNWDETGLHQKLSTIYPEKYRDFHGSTINVTALPFPPYWTEETKLDNSGQMNVTIYGGSDAIMIRAIATALNFKIRVLTSETWAQVTDQVISRRSFIAPVMYQVYPARLEQWDFTMVYEMSDMAFFLATPEVVPNWLSLANPLSPDIWLYVLILITGSTLFLFLISKEEESFKNMSICVKIIWSITVDQTLPWKTIQIRQNSARITLATILLASFLITNAYKSNLIAHLTMPEKPEKIETVEQLVSNDVRVTSPPYGAAAKKTFEESSSQVYNKLATLIDFIADSNVGLKSAVTQSTAHMADRRYLEYLVANYGERGALYVAHGGMLEARVAWPIPHDAPYQQQINEKILDILGGGLYRKWSKDFLISAERKFKGEYASIASSEPLVASSIQLPALGFQHLKGPLLLLAIGWVASACIFVIEYLMKSKNQRKK